uniref:Uncharacterized protein n=1 Tax=Desertifilum tharense IPPAS B-1220 TaxID=1781255 RepID=A0ACD5GUV3_9CYAN
MTVKTQTATSSSYAPSVPLSVYRELAAEMQANQCHARVFENSESATPATKSTPASRN